MRLFFLPMLGALALAAAGPDDDVELLKPLLPESRLIQPASFTLEEEDLQELSAATDGAEDPFSAYRGKGLDPRQKKDVDLTYILAWGRSGEARVRVALATVKGGKVLAARALAVEPASAGTPESLQEFLGQFEGNFGMKTSQNSWNPVSTLEERLEAGRKAETEDGKKVAFLLRQVESMRGNQALTKKIFAGIQEESTAVAVEARDLEKGFEVLLGEADSLRVFLDEKAASVYAGKAKAVAELSAALATTVEKKDWPGAVELLSKRMQAACGSCHGWDEHGVQGATTLQDVFRKERTKLDIGEGYFVVGHDLERDTAVPDALQQAAAFAVKKAMLFPSIAEFE